MKVLLVFSGGPADGVTDTMSVKSSVPFHYRIKSKVGDRQVPGKNEANIAVYVFSRLDPGDPPKWIYHHHSTMTKAEFRVWQTRTRNP
jgi:hypothetical protein